MNVKDANYVIIGEMDLGLAEVFINGESQGFHNEYTCRNLQIAVAKGGEHYYFNYKAVYYNKSLYKRNQQAIHNESTEFYKLLKKSYDEEIIRHLKEKDL